MKDIDAQVNKVALAEPKPLPRGRAAAATMLAAGALEQKALQQLPGALIAVSGCADDRPATQPAPPRKVPFPLPPLAPAEQ